MCLPTMMVAEAALRTHESYLLDTLKPPRHCRLESGLFFYMALFDY
jgi:hypothetical protein